MNLNTWVKINPVSRTRAILTSYEIVCAIPRRAPSRAYLEFEAQPAERVAYTLSLDTARKNKIENDITIEGELVG